LVGKGSDRSVIAIVAGWACEHRLRLSLRAVAV
jgi:hypothetical protein